MIKRFYVILHRGKLNNDIYVAGIFQGLLYGLCSIPCETTLWDCEQFKNLYLFPVDCKYEHIKKFKSIADLKYPGLYEIKEEEIQS